MPAVTTPPDIAEALWKPVVFRAVLAAVFGGLSVFWPAPGAAALAYCFAAYLVLSSKAVWDFAQASAVPSPVRRYLAGAAVAWSLASVAMLLISTTDVVAIAGGTALVASGLLELFAWLRHRREVAAVRDFLVTGMVSVGTGAALLGSLVLDLKLDAHGLLGIAGGGAIIMAVFGLIAAFGYRHDARRS